MTDLQLEDPPARPVELDAAKIATALRGFFRLADAWALTADEARTLLGQPARATFFQWKAGQVGRVPYDTIRRISWLFGIWKALQILFAVPERADAWLRQPNALLGGRTALERMLAGDVTDLAAVRELLDYARGGGV